jgi:hypothetical protein
VYRSEYHKRGELFWADRYEGYGLPVVAPMRDALVGNDKAFF